MLKKLPCGKKTASFALTVPLLLAAAGTSGAEFLGDFVKPFASVSETYDSNIFRVKDQAQLSSMMGPKEHQMSDFITQTTVGSSLHYGLSSLESNVLLRKDFYNYLHYSSQNDSRDELSADLSVRLMDRVRVKVDGGYVKEPQPRADFRSPGLNEITTIQYGLLVGYDMPSGLGFEGAYRRIGVDYSLPELKTSEYDLDRYTGTVKYHLSPEAMVYASYQREYRNYREGMQLDELRVKSDNVGDTVRLGIEKSFGPKTAISANIGYHRRTHDHLSGRDFSGPVGKAEVRYALTSKVGVVVNAERALYEETYRDQIYSVNDSVGAGLEYQVTEKVKASVMDRVTWKNFRGVPGTPKRNDTTNQVTTGVEWTPRDRVSVTLNYQYSNRGSSDSSFNYSDHTIAAGVAYKF